MNEIPVFKPLLEQEELAACEEALRTGWLGMGAYVGQFEEAVRDLLETRDRQVVAVSTGHAALHLAMMLIGAGPDDEIIVPSFNNIADFQAITAVGASPVFCDIDDRTLCLDVRQAEALVTARTKAIIVTDYGCQLCDHDAIAAFAAKHGLRVIHDAAHSFGSRYRGRRIGSASDLCMFSFDPVKTITCIDGGVLVTRTVEERRALHEMRLIGMTQPSETMYQNRRAWTYDVQQLGFRYHMANLHAALGLAQLRKLDVIAQSRREVCRTYNRRLASIHAVRAPDTDFSDIVPFLYWIRVPAVRREDLRSSLREQGIDTGIHWQPGHWFTRFQGARRGELRVTEAVGNEILTLPLHSKMSAESVERVIVAVERFFR